MRQYHGNQPSVFGPSIMARQPWRTLLPDQRRVFAIARCTAEPEMTSKVVTIASGT